MEAVARKTKAASGTSKNYERQKRYYENNKERCLAASKLNYEKNKKKIITRINERKKKIKKEATKTRRGLLLVPYLSALPYYCLDSLDA